MWRTLCYSAVMAAWLGCQQSDGPPLMDTALRDEMRNRVVLDEEPADTMTLHDLYDQLAELGEGVATEKEVVVVGRVGGLEDPDSVTDSRAKWTLGFAEFKLVDPAGEENIGAEAEHAESESDVASAENDDHAEAGEDHTPHDHSDPDHECPFCDHEGPGIQTIVRFLDDDGELLPIDARVLFKLDGEDIVVVRGTARLEPGNIVITGTGMYVRY